MAKKVYFRSYRFDNDPAPYSHFYIEVFTLPYREASRGPTATFKWQRDPDSDGWYAAHVKIEADNAANLDEATILAKRVSRKTLAWGCEPEDIIERLKKMRAVEVVYDGREMRYVELAQVKPEGWHWWTDDYEAMGKPSGATYGCIAENKDDFVSRVIVTRNGYDNEYFERWRESGYPSKCHRNKPFDAVPDTTPAIEKCKES